MVSPAPCCAQPDSESLPAPCKQPTFTSELHDATERFSAKLNAALSERLLADVSSHTELWGVKTEAPASAHAQDPAYQHQRLKLRGSLELMVESGLCDTFESRLVRWQGMAEADPEQALQALEEMSRVSARTVTRVPRARPR
jgi:hypothetical protein